MVFIGEKNISYKRFEIIRKNYFLSRSLVGYVFIFFKFVDSNIKCVYL